ncbi:MAG TPA: TorF family putative porin [Sphingomonadaceae bacterium]|nr:TorF family putative porin [Sphingomonadaceae bacterium]
MLTSVRSLMAATVLAGAALAATPAMAQDEETPIVTVSGNVALVTDYRFRGVGLSGGDPAIQGGITLNTAPGFYVGTWASSLEDSPTYGEMELDVFAGWAGDITDGIGIDVGATYYLYPTNDVDPADVFELYAKVKPTVGPLALTFGVAYSPDQDSLGSNDNLYLSADAAIAVPSTPLTLNGHVGYTDGGLAAALTNNSKAWDWSVGASMTVLGNVSLGVSYVGVENDSLFAADGVTDDTIVGSLSVSF